MAYKLKYDKMVLTKNAMFHDIQALLDISQRSHNLHLLIMSFNIRDKVIYNSFEVVPLFKRFT